MRSLSLAVGAIVGIAAALLARPLVAQQQTSATLQYLVVTPYVTQLPDGRNARLRPAYAACLAGGPQWTCRDFEPPRDVVRDAGRIDDEALRVMLVTLGSEGWELVSTLDTTPDNFQMGMTYLFKRQLR